MSLFCVALLLEDGFTLTVPLSHWRVRVNKRRIIMNTFMYRGNF